MRKQPVFEEQGSWPGEVTTVRAAFQALLLGDEPLVLLDFAEAVATKRALRVRTVF